MRINQILSSALVLLFICLLVTSTAHAEVVERHLTISSKRVNLTGAERIALTVNGTTPAPVLRFTEGDDVVIHVKNELSEPSSIHWHGLLLPNRMDGVPNMTYPPIKPGETFTYRFPLRQSGTYWYHSHSALQEQRGLYGAFVIDPRVKTALDSIPDEVIVLSDWTNERPSTVLHTLKRGSEWYSIKKRSAQSILGAAELGMLGDYFKRELGRMPPMDLSDVYYDAFLINGSKSSEKPTHQSDKLRLRIINGSASTFFYTQFSGGPMEIVASDGQVVEPFKENRLLLGVAETYDVIVSLKEGVSHEFRATSHDNSGHASLWLGSGVKEPAPDVPWPNLYKAMHSPTLKSLGAITPWGAMGMSEDAAMPHNMMNMAGKHGAHQHHQHHTANEVTKSRSAEPRSFFGLLKDDISNHKNIAINGSKERPNAPYDRLRSPERTTYSPKKDVREIKLTLDGDMERYVWMLNNKVMSEESTIKIHKGEVVRFVMVNRTMMYHPMHLHGHFFRVLNKHGAYSPLKHTVIVAPMDTTTIEFDAVEEGDWFFHCHLLYHMMSGMARMVHYQGFTPPGDITFSKLLHDHFYYMGNVSALSNMSQGRFVLSNSRNIFTTEYQVGWGHVKDYQYEATPLYEYYLNRFWNVFIGANIEGDRDELERDHGVAGFRYLLPLNIETRHWLDSDLGYQVAFEKTLELTPRFHLTYEGEYDTEDKWELRSAGTYQLSRDVSLQAQWHSKYEWGGGIQVSF